MIDFLDHITLLQPRIRHGAGGINSRHDDAFGVRRQTQLLNRFIGNVPHGHPFQSPLGIGV